MRKRWIAGLLLVAILWCVCGCAQTEAELPAEEPENTETVPEETAENGAPDAVEEPAGDAPDEELPETPAEDMTAEEKELAAFLGLDRLPEDLTEKEYEDLVELMLIEKWTIEYTEKTGSAGASGNSSGSDVPADPMVDPETGLRRRTEEEVYATVRYAADSYKDSPAFHNMTDEAEEHLEELLYILKNDPESDDSLRSYIESYRCGALTEEECIFLLQSWVQVAGPFGTGKITVQ